MPKARQKRVILFVHDGSGLGHLRRIARIAESLQGPFATLVVTGMREAMWVVPYQCEVLRLPSWDGIKASRAQQADRPMWLDTDWHSAVRFRQDLIVSAVRCFSPDAILVDYLPFGQYSELGPALADCPARKYLVLRGFVDTSDLHIFSGAASQEIADTYDRIFLAADRKVLDIADDCYLEPPASYKVQYVGYVAPAPDDRTAVRQARGLGPNDAWVVCSAGSGLRAEEFLRQCIAVANLRADLTFDVIFGPKARGALTRVEDAPANCRVYSESASLADWHAAADVVISSGGYNSILEAAVGGAHLIVHPNQFGADDEQVRNAIRLSAFYPIRLLSSTDALGDELAAALDCRALSPRPVLPLDVSGAAVIRETLTSDLSRLE